MFKWYLKLMLKSFLCLLVASTAACKSFEKSKPSENDFTTIYVIEAALHSSIALPVQTYFVDWDTLVNFEELNGRKNHFTHLGFGWGDYNYYLKMAKNRAPGFKTGAKALFLPTKPVLKIDGYVALNESFNVIAVPVNKFQFDKLLNYIIGSFEMDEQLKPQKVSAGIRKFDAFYESHGTYCIFNNSNHWTARALRNAGISAPLAPISSKPIMRILRKNY
jgi:uncharacterized protein (TIGR02117 family)